MLRDGGWEPGRATGWDEADIEKNYGILLRSGTSWKNMPLTCVSVELLAQHEPDTVRGNMYLVVSAGWLPDTGEKSYNRIQRLLNRLRESGTVPFEWIVDNVRSTIKPASWSGLQDFAEGVRDLYRKSFWAQLPDYVVIIVEKDTIAGKVSQVTREYDVPLHVIRGYSSTSYAWQIAQQWADVTKPIIVYYLGDHDPSGRDLERNIQEKLTRYSKRGFQWYRLGVNLGHFRLFDINPLQAKKSDKRYKKFVREWGEQCAEVEAIPATNLRQMIRDAIEGHVPEGEWERLQQIEDVEKKQWADFMKGMKGGA